MAGRRPRPRRIARRAIPRSPPGRCSAGARRRCSFEVRIRLRQVGRRGSSRGMAPRPGLLAMFGRSSLLVNEDRTNIVLRRAQAAGADRSDPGRGGRFEWPIGSRPAPRRTRPDQAGYAPRSIFFHHERKSNKHRRPTDVLATRPASATAPAAAPLRRGTGPPALARTETSPPDRRSVAEPPLPAPPERPRRPGGDDRPHSSRAVTRVSATASPDFVSGHTTYTCGAPPNQADSSPVTDEDPRAYRPVGLVHPDLLSLLERVHHTNLRRAAQVRVGPSA